MNQGRGMLELNKEVAEWLLKKDVIALKEVGSTRSMAHSCVLTLGSSVCFANGLYVAKLVQYLQNKKDIESDRLSELDVGESAAVKLANWNKLVPELSTLGVNIDQDTKALIVAGDQGALIDVLNQLYINDGHELHNEVVAPPPVPDFHLPNEAAGVRAGLDDALNRSSSQSMKGGGSTATLGASSSDSKTSLRHTTKTVVSPPDGSPAADANYLQGLTTPKDFLGATLARALNISKDKAQLLVEQNSTELYHLIVTATSQFDDPILVWYQDMFSKHTVLIHFLNSNERQMRDTLAVLRNGLFSLSSEVAVWTARLISQVTESFKHSRSMMESAWTWFIDRETSGLEAVISCLERHPSTKRALFGLLEAYCNPNRWYSLFSNYLKIFVSDPCDYMTFVMEFIKLLANSHIGSIPVGEVGQPLINSNGVIYYLTDLALTNSEIAGLEAWRISAIQMVTELWLHFPSLIDSTPARSNAALLAIQDAVQDPCIELQLIGALCAFHLLDEFIRTRNNYAPAVYRLLANLLGTTSAPGPLKDLLLTNLVLTLRQNQTIPVGVLVEPMIKHMSSYVYSNQEYELILEFVRHPTLSDSHALLLMHLLGHISCTDPTYGRLASVPFLLLCDRFRDDEEFHRFIGEFSLRIGNAYLNLQTMKNRELKANGGQHQDFPTVVTDDELCQLLVVELLAKLVDLNISAYNKKVIKVVRGVVEKYHKMFHEESCDLLNVLNFFHELPTVNGTGLAGAPKLKLSKLHPPAVIAPVDDGAARVGFARRAGVGNSARKSPHALAPISAVSTEYLDDDIEGPYGQKNLFKDKSNSFSDLLNHVNGAVDEKFFKAPRIGGPPPITNGQAPVGKGGARKLGANRKVRLDKNGVASPVPKKRQPQPQPRRAADVQAAKRNQAKKEAAAAARARVKEERLQNAAKAKRDVPVAPGGQARGEHEDPADYNLRQARTLLQRGRAKREHEKQQAQRAADLAAARRVRLEAVRAEIEERRKEDEVEQKQQRKELARREKAKAAKRIADYRKKKSPLDQSQENVKVQEQIANDEKAKRKAKMDEFLVRQKQRERTMRERQKQGIGVVKAVVDEQEAGTPVKKQPVHSPSPKTRKTQPKVGATQPSKPADENADESVTEDPEPQEEIEDAAGSGGEAGEDGPEGDKGSEGEASVAGDDNNDAQSEAAQSEAAQSDGYASTADDDIQVEAEGDASDAEDSL